VQFVPIAGLHLLFTLSVVISTVWFLTYHVQLTKFMRQSLFSPRVTRLFDPRAEFATACPLEGRIQCGLRNLCKI